VGGSKGRLERGGKEGGEPERERERGWGRGRGTESSETDNERDPVSLPQSVSLLPSHSTLAPAPSLLSTRDFFPPVTIPLRTHMCSRVSGCALSSPLSISLSLSLSLSLSFDDIFGGEGTP